MTDIAGLIREAKLPEKVVAVCLRPDLVAEHEETERQMAAKSADSLAGTGSFQERLAVLRGEMTAFTVPFVFRAMPRAKFRALAAKHPPRRDAQDRVVPEDVTGINDSTFPEALIRACLVDPELDDELWAALEDKLTDRQYQVLVDVAWNLNRSQIDVPFSLAESQRTSGSGPR